VPERRVCEVIFGILKYPEQLRAGLPFFGDEEW